MKNNPEKAELRKRLLEKRDTTSFDLLEIASKNIHNNIHSIESFKKARKIGAYYPLGNEVRTQDIMQEILSEGKELFLPRVVEKTLEFRKINDFSSLQTGNFDIMEPKEECKIDNNLDILIVPTIGITPKGVRLGYGHGFYDRFLAENKIETIAPVLEKQIVNKIPKLEHDIVIDWIVTEKHVIKTQ